MNFISLACLIYNVFFKLRIQNKPRPQLFVVIAAVSVCFESHYISLCFKVTTVLSSSSPLFTMLKPWTLDIYNIFWSIIECIHHCSLCYKSLELFKWFEFFSKTCFPRNYPGLILSLHLALKLFAKPGIGCSAHARTAERIILMPCFVKV